MRNIILAREGNWELFTNSVGTVVIEHTGSCGGETVKTAFYWWSGVKGDQGDQCEMCKEKLPPSLEAKYHVARMVKR